MSGSVYKVVYRSPNCDAIYTRYCRTVTEVEAFVASLQMFWMTLGYDEKQSDRTLISIEEV